jgi:hypothetical protein
MLWSLKVMTANLTITSKKAEGHSSFKIPHCAMDYVCLSDFLVWPDMSLKTVQVWMWLRRVLEIG